jgi:hypothetical protein
MKQINSALLALAVFTAMVITTTTSRDGLRAVHAQSGCGVASLNGTYSFAFSGFSTHGPGPHGSVQFPFDGAGIATFDGAGNLSATYAASFDGSGSTGNSYTSTYTVNPDCTGLTTSANGGDTFALVIASGGADVLATDVSPGTTLNMEFKKQ